MLVKGTVVVALDLAVGGLVAINLVIFRMMKMPQPLTLVSQSATLGVALLLLMVLFDMPVNQLLFTSAQLAFSHPWRSVLLLLAGLFPLLLGLVLPAAIMINVCVSASALLINWGAWRVIRLFIGAEDRARLEVTQPFQIQGQNKRTV